MAANLGIDVGTDVKLVTDEVTSNSETAHRQGVVEFLESIGSGRKTVTTPGTEVPLSSVSLPLVRKVDVQAELDNTDVVVVGSGNSGSGVEVVAALATRRGIALEAGDSYTLYVNDLADVYIDAVVAGEGVTFNYFS